MQTDSTAMKGGANSQPASWEAVDEGAAAGLASDRLAQAKLPFQVPPSQVPQQGSGGDTAHDDNSDVISKLKQRPSMTLYHCRPTAFTTALDIYLATSSPSLVSSPFECACVGSYAASCTGGANSSSCVCGGECVRALGLLKSCC